METSSTLLLIITFATVIQFMVDRIKGIVGDKVMKYIKSPVWAFALGVGIAFLFKIDIFAMFGFQAEIQALAYILTGLILSAGASPIHELIETIRTYRTDK